MKKIVILGAGFGAISAVLALAKLKSAVSLQLIAPKPRFCYLPSSIWIPFGLRTKEQLEFPLTDFFNKHQVSYTQASVTGLDAQHNLVKTDQGEVSYDYLIIATGARYLKKIPGINEHVIIPCEGLDSAERYRQKLSKMTGGRIAFGFSGNPKDPSAMRGGPVFEFMFGTDTYLRRQGIRDKFDLLFVSPAPQPGKRLGERAVQAILQEVKNKNIKTYLGSKISAFGANSITTETDNIETDITLFMPGLTGTLWLADSDLALTDGGFIEADEKTKAVGFDNVFVVGDCGSFPGPDWAPKQAHMADLQAEAATKNIANLISGKKADHTFKTELVCIIDSLDSGAIVYRSAKRSIIFKSKLLHYSKRFFEKYYLRKIR